MPPPLFPLQYRVVVVIYYYYSTRGSARRRNFACAFTLALTPLVSLFFLLALDDLVLAEDLFDDFDDFHLHFRILDYMLRPAQATNFQSAAASTKVSVYDIDTPKLGWDVLCNTNRLWLLVVAGGTFQGQSLI